MIKHFNAESSLHHRVIARLCAGIGVVQHIKDRAITFQNDLQL